MECPICPYWEKSYCMSDKTIDWDRNRLDGVIPEWIYYYYYYYYLILEDKKGFIKGCEEFYYLGVRIDKEGRQGSDIKNRINKDRATIAMLNSILWDRNTYNERS